MGIGKRENLIEDLLIKNYEKYYHLAYKYVHNEEDALDIVQEGAYKAILKCDTLKDEAFAETWIYRIMLNEIYGLCRKIHPQEEEDVDIVGLSDVLSVEKLDLRNAIAKLSEEEQAILDLRYFKDFKLSDVADMLGINLSTAKSRLYRTITKLRDELT